MTFITDCSKQFAVFTGNKILVSPYEILETSFLDEGVIHEINGKMNGYENQAAKLAIEELTSIANSDIQLHSNKFVKSVSDFEQKYSILYTYFQIEVKSTLCLKRLIEFISEKIPGQISLNLSESHIRLKQTINATNCIFRKEKNDFLNVQIRSNLKKLKTKIKGKHVIEGIGEKTHICIVCFNTPSDYYVYFKVLEHLKDNPAIHVSIVEIDSGINTLNSNSLKNFACSNITVNPIADFEGGHPSKVNYLRFRKELQQLDQNTYRFKAASRYVNEIFYSTFENIIDKLKPTLFWYNNTSEIGRSLALTSKHKNTPVICIDYALFSNDYLHMASRIQFTARMCISEYTSEVWRSKFDPTPVHYKIGLLKLDDYHKIERTGINKQTTLFFASTWGGTNPLYNYEKRIVVEQLLNYCEKNQYKLIVKKHPAENDDTLEHLKSRESESFRIFDHNEISLNDALQISDIAITQNSSIGAEAMLFRIPTVYFNPSDNENTKSIIAINNTEFVFFISSIDELDCIIKEKANKLSDKAYNEAIEYFLYKLDGKAYLRLIEKTLKMILT